MAASVRVEDEAFSDTRFEVLGVLLGTSKFDALGRLAYVWRQATAMGVDVLPMKLVAQIIDVAALCESGLGVETKSGIRIKGARGRVEWLEKKREAGRRNGLKGAEFGRQGGRPKKTPKGGYVGDRSTGFEGVQENPPPATATAPVTATAPTSKDSPLPPFDSEAFGEAWRRWDQHRREIKKKLTPSTVKQQFAELAAMGEDRAITAIYHSIGKGWTGIYEPDRKANTNANGVPGKPDPHRYDPSRDAEYDT